MNPKLQVDLGLDGKGFEADFNKLAYKTNAAMVSTGRQMGQRFTSGFMSILGLISLSRLMSQLSQWGRDADGMANRYREMGIVIEDGMVRQLREAGREIERMNLEIQKNTLPLLVKVSTTILAIMSLTKRVGAFTKGFAGGLKAPKITGKDVFASILKPWHIPLKVLSQTNWKDAAGLGAFDLGLWQYRDIMRQTRELMYKPPATAAEEEERAQSFSAGSATRPSLTSIGGTVGLLEDRLFRIEQEQLRQLKAIVSNTKKGKTGTLEV